LNDINELLNSKANKEQVTGFLHRKANKADIDISLKNKVDLLEFQNLVQLVNQKADNNELDKISKSLDTKADKFEINNLTNSVSFKIDKSEIDNFHLIINEIKRENNMRFQENDLDFERLIDNIKSEFQVITSAFKDFEVKKADYKEIEKITTNLSKKLEIEMFNSSLTKVKSDINDSIESFKTDITQNKR